jgi:hypothetical protein
VGIDYAPYESVYEPGFEDMDRRVPCIDKVVELTGHSPQVRLDQALINTWNWMRAEDKRESAAASQLMEGAVA